MSKGWFNRSGGFDTHGEFSSTVVLCVGNATFATTHSTLKTFADHPVFGPILSGKAAKSEEGVIVLDHDSEMFRHILHFMRHGALHLPPSFDEWDMLLAEVRSLKLPTLEALILAKYEYQLYEFRKSLPQAVFIHWPTTIIVNATHTALGSGVDTNGHHTSQTSGQALARQALAVSISPPLPSLAVSEEGRSVLFTDPSHRAVSECSVTPSSPVVITDLDQLVMFLLSSYGYTVSHWKEKEGKVFLTLGHGA